MRQRPLLFTILTFIAVSLACNAFAGSEEPAFEPPPPAVSDLTGTPPGDEDQDRLAPTATLPGTPVGDVSTPTGATVRVLVDLNVRSGPGVQYERVGFLLQGETAPIIGRSPDTGWWKIVCPPRAEGNECWVSGGANFSRAENAENVPVAAVPPTPTPRAAVTPTPERESEVIVRPAESAILAYSDRNGIWVAPLDVESIPPSAGTPRQVVNVANVRNLLISPDGGKIAYVAGTETANVLGVVDVDGSNGRILARSADIPVSISGDPNSVAVFIDGVQWQADSQGLVFNTAVINLEGPGAGSQEDLWTVSLSGAPQQRFAGGQGGGAFAVYANNQVILARPTQIVRANLDSAAQEVVVSFGFINTASEYIYYPQPQWMADGSRAYVAIPSQEQFDAQATFTLWEIPATGAARQLVTPPGNILFGRVVWTPNGDRVAYVAYPMSGADDRPALTWAGGNGSNPVVYARGRQLALFGWSPDSNHFLYAGSDYYAIGRPGSSHTQVVISGETADMRWLNGESFVVAIGRSGSWNLLSSNLEGASLPLVTSSAAQAQFDVWAP